MMRSFALAAALTSALGVSAMAADATTTVDPAVTLAIAASVPAPSPAVTAAQPATSMPLTTQDGLAWVNKPVYSLDGTNLGKVVDFQRGTDNGVISMHADVGGICGIGMARVSLMTPQFKLQGDRVVLNLTAAEEKALRAI